MNLSHEDRDDLAKRVRDLLWHDWDPIGVKQWPEARDEYDSYAPRLTEFVLSGASHQEIFDHLWRLETDHMGLRGDKSRTENMARQLGEMQKEVLGET